MSLRKMAELFCDGCSEWLTLDTGRISDYWDELKKEGWTRSGGGVHYWPSCSAHNKKQPQENKGQQNEY